MEDSVRKQRFLLLAVVLLREQWQGNQVAGLALAGVGLVLIGSAHGLTMPLAGFKRLLSLSP